MAHLIGIGVSSDPSRVADSVLRFSHPEKVVCYCSEEMADLLPSSLNIVPDIDPGRRMISDLMDGSLSAAVRGTLSSHDTLHVLKKACGITEIERIVLLQTVSGKKFFLAPVGIDEGWTVSQKVSLIRKGREILGKFGMPETVGVLSGGRLGDAGRHKIVDRTLADAELVAKLTGARHFEILIEEAIDQCSLIIAPDGISGNLIFRTLLFAGNGVSHGAPVVNIERIFIDTSRVNPDYSQALILAASMIE